MGRCLWEQKMFLLHISVLAQNTQTESIKTSEYNNDAHPDCNYLVVEKSIWFPNSHLKMSSDANVSIKMYLEFHLL